MKCRIFRKQSLCVSCLGNLGSRYIQASEAHQYKLLQNQVDIGCPADPGTTFIIFPLMGLLDYASPGKLHFQAQTMPLVGLSIIGFWVVLIFGNCPLGHDLGFHSTKSRHALTSKSLVKLVIIWPVWGQHKWQSWENFSKLRALTLKHLQSIRTRGPILLNAFCQLFARARKHKIAKNAKSSIGWTWMNHWKYHGQVKLRGNVHRQQSICECQSDSGPVSAFGDAQPPVKLRPSGFPGFKAQHHFGAYMPMYNLMYLMHYHLVHF